MTAPPPTTTINTHTNTLTQKPTKFMVSSENSTRARANPVCNLQSTKFKPIQTNRNETSCLTKRMNTVRRGTLAAVFFLLAAVTFVLNNMFMP